MNTFFLGISGSWLILILLIIISLLFSLYIYRRTVPEISSRKKVLLIALRTIAITLLIFTIFEPILTVISGKEEPPKIAVLLDNSVSMTLKDGSGDRKEKYHTALQTLNLQDEENIIVNRFDSELQNYTKFSLDSLDYSGQYTDISKALKWTANNAEKDNIAAAILITDGAFNMGENPVYQADKFGKPVFTIGIGDSSEQKDISIQSLITNEVCYVNQPVPININIAATGYNNAATKVSLNDNAQKISEQTLNLISDKNQYSLVFDYTPQTEGMHKIEVKSDNLDGELSYKNNTLTDFIKVQKIKKRISLFAGAPSPDLSFIKNELLKVQNVEIKTYIQKKGAEFYDAAPNQQEINKIELFVFVGFPIISTPASILDAISDNLERGKSLFFIASLETDYNKLKSIQKFLPFTVISSRQHEYMALPDLKPQQLSNPLIRINGNDDDLKLWNQLPPLFRTETFVNVKPESEVAVSIKVNNTPLNEPLIVSRTFQSQKTVAVLGYGLYRWKLLGYAPELAKGRQEASDVYTAFLNNCLKWLSATDENKLIIIKTSKKSYSNNERVEFISQIYDGAFSPIENANVKVQVTSGTDRRDIILNNAGNGRYTGYIERMKEGLYGFTGEVFVSNKKIGSDDGKFSVGEIALEYQNLRMNVELLRNISDRTGGKFYLPDNVDKILDEIKKLKSYTSRSITLKSEFTIWNRPWLLAFAILLLGLEWFIRKRNGMV